MAVEIAHVETQQRRRKNILARYPDVSVVQGRLVADSAAADATSIMQARDEINGGHRDVLEVYACLSDDGSQLAAPHELPIHVVAGAMRIGDALLALRERHPGAYEVLRQVILSGGTDLAGGDLPW